MRRVNWFGKMTTEVPLQVCKCGQEMELMSPAPGVNGTRRDEVPRPGNAITFCIGCAQAYLVLEDWRVEPVDVGELFKDDPAQLREMRRVQAAIIATRRVPS